jgi:quinol-cytochrome oxidoreductase complex cytochrome b subunit
MNIYELPSRVKSWIKTQCESEVAIDTRRTSVMLGSVTIIGMSLVLLVVTGVLLSFNYQPNANELRSNNGELLYPVRTLRDITDSDGDTLYSIGELVLADTATLRMIGKRDVDYAIAPTDKNISKSSNTGNDVSLLSPSHAYLSTEILIQDEIKFGNIIRAIHKGSVHCLIFSSLFLFTFLILTKIVASAQTLRWWLFNTLIFICVFSAWSGSILPWNIRSYSALNVGMTLTENYTPLFGEWIGKFFSYMNTDILLQRVFVLHSIVLPIAIIILVSYLRKITPFIQLKKSSIRGLLLSVSVVAIAVVSFAVLNTNGIYPPFNTLQPSTMHTQPEWYFMGSYALLNTLPEDLAVTLLAVVSVVLFLFPIMSSSERSSNIWLKLAQIVVCLLWLVLIGAQMM